MSLESHSRKAIVVGISGASSSGKTTLSRLIRDIFPNTFVLHEDDFYKPEKDLPSKNGLLDWDCAEALDIPAMIQTMDYIQQNGTFPSDFDSKEDRNDIGKCPVSAATINELKETVLAWATERQVLQRHRVCIFDGFLLYTPSLADLQKHLDVKFFLQVSYAKAKARREARSGYATIEGFWEDPPGYVDQIVWPNYVDSHAWMFENGDVEGVVREEVKSEWGVEWIGEGSEVDEAKAVDVEMEIMLRWIVQRLMIRLEEIESVL